jgi:hypothetical protein
MMHRYLRTLFILAAFFAASVHAEVTLTFELSGPGDEKSTRNLCIAGFFVRVDDPAQPDIYHLDHAGKFFPLYLVDRSKRTHRLLTPGVKPTLKAGSKNPASVGNPVGSRPNAETEQGSVPPAPGPAAAAHKPTEAAQAPVRPDGAPAAQRKAAAKDVKGADGVRAGGAARSDVVLRPSGKSGTVAGVRCRVIEERIGDRAVMEHCMANTARLGIRECEIRTLARLLVMARERGFGWLGTATEDEDFVSIQSRDPLSGATLELKALSLDFLPQDYLQIPKGLQESHGCA